MANGGRTTFAPKIERLGINEYRWGTECLRGDVQAGPATAFPQALGMSAIFRYSIHRHIVRIVTSCYILSKVTLSSVDPIQQLIL